jgi:dimethylamine monooxygenase subunit A
MAAFMLHYFPFDSDDYEMTMNARAGVSSLIEIDPAEYHHELRLKEDILASDYTYYFQCADKCLPMAWEAISTVLPNMAAHFPEHFSLSRSGDLWTWENRLLDTKTVFVIGKPSSLRYSPLDWLGRQVQEDLIMMAPDSEGNSHCVAGQLCFASGWCLNDKVGKDFLAVHAAVPFFRDHIGNSSDLMMRRLKPGRSTGRLNWTISAANRLNLAPKTKTEWAAAREGITAQNAGYRCFLRVERQTLTRLPETNAVLFTIHSYINPVAEIAVNPAKFERFTRVIKGIPAATLEYKGMAGYVDSLIDYLETQILAFSTA